MKISFIRKNIIISFSVSAALLLLLGLTVKYTLKQQAAITAQIDKIKTEAIATREQAAQIQNKSIEVEKYKELWKNLSDEKKDTSGIKIDFLNNKLATISAKYNIITPKVKATLPENLKGGVFDCRTVNVALSQVDLEFDAASDIRALSFISDLVKSMTGRIVINNIEIKKVKKYESQELVDLSAGRSGGLVRVKFGFFWYSYKEKTDSERVAANNIVVRTAPTNQEKLENKGAQ